MQLVRETSGSVERVEQLPRPVPGIRHSPVVPQPSDGRDGTAQIEELNDDALPAGSTPIDTGTLARCGRLLEPGSTIYGRPLLPAEARRLVSLG